MSCPKCQTAFPDRRLVFAHFITSHPLDYIRLKHRSVKELIRGVPGAEDSHLIQRLLNEENKNIRQQICCDHAKISIALPTAKNSIELPKTTSTIADSSPIKNWRIPKRNSSSTNAEPSSNEMWTHKIHPERLVEPVPNQIWAETKILPIEPIIVESTSIDDNHLPLLNTPPPVVVQPIIKVEKESNGEKKFNFVARTSIYNGQASCTSLAQTSLPTDQDYFSDISDCSMSSQHSCIDANAYEAKTKKLDDDEVATERRKNREYRPEERKRQRAPRNVIRRRSRSDCRRSSTKKNRKKDDESNRQRVKADSAMTRLLLPCLICSKAFSSPKEILEHELSSHETIQRYSCPMCPAHCFSNVDELKHHIELSHPSEKRTNLQCYLCMKRFPLWSPFLEHIQADYDMKRLRHYSEIEKQLPIKCRECNLLFVDVSAWFSHENKCARSTKPTGIRFFSDMPRFGCQHSRTYCKHFPNCPEKCSFAHANCRYDDECRFPRICRRYHPKLEGNKWCSLCKQN